MLVKRARARGEVTPDTQDVIDHVVAPIVFRLLFGGDAVPVGLAKRLVDRVFVGPPFK